MRNLNMRPTPIRSGPAHLMTSRRRETTPSAGSHATQWRSNRTTSSRSTTRGDVVLELRFQSPLLRGYYEPVPGIVRCAETLLREQYHARLRVADRSA